VARAIVLNTAFKSSLTGGTFADTLAAGTSDSLAVANFPTGGARVLEAWGIDSASVAELSWVFTRPESTHDQQRGLRMSIPALVPGGAGAVASHMVLSGYSTIDLYPSDVCRVDVSGTAADAVVFSWVTLYDNLPGAAGVFENAQTISNLQKSIVGIRVSAVASGTKGQYGATRAFNTDDDRLHANTWYAILGATVQTQVTTISLLGPDWGGQRVGLPAGALDTNSGSFFLDQSWKWQQLACIPCFNSNNRANIFVSVADSAASTSPQIDFILYELKSPPPSANAL
jgi:hypothetical protein